MAATNNASVAMTTCIMPSLPGRPFGACSASAMACCAAIMDSMLAPPAEPASAIRTVVISCCTPSTSALVQPSTRPPICASRRPCAAAITSSRLARMTPYDSGSRVATVARRSLAQVPRASMEAWAASVARAAAASAATAR